MRQLKITKSITNRESASLDKYLQEIGREELITVEEEVELAQRIRKGDQQVKTPQDVIDIVKKSKRAVFVQGVTPSGKTGYFGFGI